MKVLVTGGGGFLGRHIVESLQIHGFNVRVMGRQKQPSLESRGIEFIQGDISSLEDAQKAVNGVDAVFHVAGRARLDMDYQAYYSANVIGTQNIVQACLRYGVNKLVFTSTPAVVFNGQHLSGADESLPLQPHYHWYYTQTKALAEKYVLDHNTERLKTVAIRPHLMLGNRDPHLLPQILQCAKKRKLKIVGDGKNKIDITFVENAAYAHVLALDALESGKACGNAYFIGQETPVILWEFINLLLEKFGLSPVTQKITFRRAYDYGYFMELYYKLFRRSKVPPMTRALAVALGRDHYFSHKRAEEDLGYKPLISIEQGLDRLTNILHLS